MTKEELRAYLATNLTIELDSRNITYDTKEIKVSIKLEDQVLDTDRVYI